MNFFSQMEKKIVNNPRIETQLDVIWAELDPHEKNLILAVVDLLNAANNNKVTIGELYEHFENASQISMLIPSCCKSGCKCCWEGHARMGIFTTLNKEDQATILANVKIFLFNMFFEEIKAHKLAK